MKTISYNELMEKYWHKKSAPMSMYFAVTHRCNLKCRHCFVDVGKPEKELSFFEISNILKDLSQAGVFIIAFTGGEPFIREDFVDILRIAKKLGFQTYIATNGTFITPKLAAILSRERLVDELGISIYGSEASMHEKMTGVNGSFRKSITAVRLLRDKGFNVHIDCTLTSINMDYLSEIKHKGQELKVNVNFGLNIFPRKNGDTAPIGLRVPDDKLKKINEDDIFKIEKPKMPCCAATMMAHINPQGKLYPCNYLPIEVGDLIKNDFKNIWAESPKLLEIRDAIKNRFKKCNNCSHKEACNVCIAMNYLETKDICKLSREKCRLVKYVYSK